jgi:predicted transglutaminase-like cysteine proteinase
MKSAITNIVWSYAKHLREKNDPALQQQKLEYINKVDSVKRKLNECNYTKGYTYERLHFLESIETYIRNRGKLSPNQMKALNKMNNQYDKKLEKIKKKEIVK